MSAASWISFGPDLEPLEAEARRRAEAPGARPDGLLVAGAPEGVHRSLAQAGDGWCRFEQLREDGTSGDVYIQARHVRYVSEAS